VNEKDQPPGAAEPELSSAACTTTLCATWNESNSAVTAAHSDCLLVIPAPVRTITKSEENPTRLCSLMLLSSRHMHFGIPDFQLIVFEHFNRSKRDSQSTPMQWAHWLRKNLNRDAIAPSQIALALSPAARYKISAPLSVPSDSG
jgi:hypothetical protein